MDSHLRMALERLERSSDWQHVLIHISGRRDLEALGLLTADPTNTTHVARQQGRVAAFNELLALPEDAKNAA